MADRERSAEELFGELLDIDPGERPLSLLEAARDRPEVRAEVEQMLADYGHMGSFMSDSPLGREVADATAATSEMPSLAVTQLSAGSRLGRYLIERSLGAGGMGEVYRAQDTRLNRTVAIKVLPPGKTMDGPLVQRFLNEARLASSLNHPNIVALYDIAKHEAIDFLVMEYVEGRTLADLIKTEPMQFDLLIELGTQVALALGAAHAAGIVHRDIKPANIMITSGQQAKVLDFGIAKGLDGGAETQLTGDGQIIGTVAYMSPEQTRGETIDCRSDIFSFGCVLYEAAAGRPPFVNASMVGLMHEINTREPELLSQYRPDLQPQFVRLVMRCLIKDRDLRPDSAMELATELKSLKFPTAPTAEVRLRHPSVAVLPLRIRGAASDQFLSLSLAEALVHRLASTGKLVVRPVSSVLRYAEKEVEWSQPARELNVDLIVEGTIQVAGGRIRVLVQVHRLIDSKTLASIKQDGDSSDLFALQDRLADSVSDMLVPPQADTKAEARTPPTKNTVAYELYLRAVDKQTHIEKYDMLSAIDMLTRATQLDPNFADAWGLLAQVYVFMASHLDADPKWFALAEDAITRTLELDPVQCTALCARSVILWSSARSFQNRAALRALNAAIRIDPARPIARHQRSAIFWHLGFTEAAAVDALHLTSANPALGYMHQGGNALQSGKFDKSVDFYHRAFEIEPHMLLTQLLSPVAILYAQRFDQARVAVAKARQIFPEESFGIGLEAILAGIDGDSKRSLALAEEASASTRSMTHAHHTWHSCAAAYALNGCPDKAIDELERCGGMGLLNPGFFMVDPYMKSLHGVPRFQNLMTQMRREQDALREEFAV